MTNIEINCYSLKPLDVLHVGSDGCSDPVLVRRESCKFFFLMEICEKKSVAMSKHWEKNLTPIRSRVEEILGIIATQTSCNLSPCALCPLLVMLVLLAIKQPAQLKVLFLTLVYLGIPFDLELDLGAEIVIDMKDDQTLLKAPRNEKYVCLVVFFIHFSNIYCIDYQSFPSDLNHIFR